VAWKQHFICATAFEAFKAFPSKANLSCMLVPAFPVIARRRTRLCGVANSSLLVPKGK
jgi:hypothetical protein